MANKNIIKTLEANESKISMILGVIVLLVAGVIFFNFFRDRQNTGTPSIESGTSTEAQQQEYVVNKGDSLWKIAQKYFNDGYKWSDIAKVNSITNPDSIEIGQKLMIPLDIASATAAAQVVSETSTPQATMEAIVTPAPVTAVVNTTPNDQKIAGVSYTVVQDDSLWKIAVRAYGDGYKWVEIANTNKLQNPDLIYPGSVFQLPR